MKDKNKYEYFIKPNPPYICQYASPNLVSELTDRKIPITNDPNWQKMGFKKVEEYEYWAFRMCGYICTRMVLHSYNLGKNETIYEMLNKALEYKGYDIEKDNGWFYKPLIDFAKSYGLQGEVLGELTIDKIKENTLKNIFTIVSVNPKVIRFDITKCPEGKKGGHLVLITGVKFDNTIKGFFIHNPSGRIKETQENAYIPIEVFNEAFAGRGFSLMK